MRRFPLDRFAFPRLAIAARCFISQPPGGDAPRPIRTAGVLRACRLAFPSSSSRPDAARGSARRLPKQYLDCAGKPLLAHTLEALAARARLLRRHRRHPPRRSRALRDRADVSLARRRGPLRPAGVRRRQPAAERARRARGAERGGARSRPHPRRRAHLSLARADRPRDRGGRASRRGDPGDRAQSTRSSRSTPRAASSLRRTALACAPCRRRRPSASI